MSRMKRQKEIEKVLSCGKPDWYWIHGLHDAEIVEVNELQLPPDYKQPDPKWNCFEMIIDAKGALFDTSVRKILLYNYKILSGNIDDLKEDKIWWISDTLCSSNQGYILEIKFERPKGSRFTLQIIFQSAAVERK